MSLVAEALRRHIEEGTYRRLEKTNAPLDFCSNDYLGLSRCPEIRAGLIAALKAGCALGSTGSRLVSGQCAEHERVEAFLAGAYRAPSALLFGSGYLANLGVITALASLRAKFFSDERNHASLVDGMRLAGAGKEIFRHNDLSHLEQLLSRSEEALKVIVTESVFSMDGDQCPLDEVLSLAKAHGAWLMLDEAHATGVFGGKALGCLEDFSKVRVPVVSVHTGGKALGAQGAFVLSSQEIRELLVNRARSFIFATALSPLSALQIELALRRTMQNLKWGEQLRKNSYWLRSKLGLSEENASQIVPVILGSNERTLNAATRLQAQGFAVRAIRSPTVPVGTERLRITVKSYHRPGELRRLAIAVKEALG